MVMIMLQMLHWVLKSTLRVENPPHIQDSCSFTPDGGSQCIMAHVGAGSRVNSSPPSPGGGGLQGCLAQVGQQGGI